MEKRVEYDLKSEIELSGKRMVRAKSGTKRYKGGDNEHN